MTDERPAWAARLQAEREARGWNKHEMARALLRAAGVEYPPVKSLVRQVRMWEAGQHYPRDWAGAYASAFTIPEAELFGPPWNRRRDPARVWPHPAAPVPPTGPVAPELVVYFLEQLPGHYCADMFLGPRHLIPTVQTQALLLEDLVRAADDPVRRGLLGAGVAYASLLGWLYQDAGDVARSSQWRNVALDMAHRSSDAQLVGYALVNKAMLAVDVSDGRAVVDYADAALADKRRLSPKVRVLGHVHRAHGYSMLDNRKVVDDALDAAQGLVDRIDDEHPWGNSCRRTPGYISVQRATAYARLGAHREAVALWDELLDAAPESARRDNGVFRTRQAASLAAIPDPERVVTIAERQAALAAETGSARLRRELLALPAAAHEWTGTRAGRHLGEIIASIA